MAKAFTGKQVDRIVHQHMWGVSIRRLAWRYGCSQAMIEKLLEDWRRRAQTNGDIRRMKEREKGDSEAAVG